MDPEAVWRDICEDIASGEIENALWLMDQLCEWQLKGGFRPDGVPMAAAIRAGQRFLEAVQRQWVKNDEESFS